jgi:hypothetical protein
MPRFVILRHDMPPGSARPTHWDLMLEYQGMLRTWALRQPPSSGCELTAEELPDHRLAYLDYEGEVSGNRGRVTRWDAGTYEIVSQAPELRIALRGEKLIGEMTFSRQSVASYRGADAPRSPEGAEETAPAAAPYWTVTWKGS